MRSDTSSSPAPAPPARADAAGDGAHPPGSVAEALFRAPHGFDFLQAVRVLRALRPEATPAAAGHEPAAEPVRFRSHVSLAFPPSDIVKVEEAADPAQPPAMTVAFLGLAGAQGPLPRAFTEQVMHQAREGHTASRDFLDLFNHRLVGLMYRARARHHPALEPPAHFRAPAIAGEADAAPPVPSTERPKEPARGEDDAMSRYLFALMGMGTRGLQREMPGLSRRALLGYAALLSAETRSAEGLERILSGHFGVAVNVVPFTGGWMALQEEDWTRIGRTGRNRTLGHDAVLGRRVWDAQGAFTLRVGPLSLHEYLRLLPGTDAFRAMSALTRFYVGVDLEFTIELVLRREQVPRTELSARKGARLGWTSWLRTRPHRPGDKPDEDAEVRLAPARHGADPAAPP